MPFALNAQVIRTAPALVLYVFARYVVQAGLDLGGKPERKKKEKKKRLVRDEPQQQGKQIGDLCERL